MKNFNDANDVIQERKQFSIGSVELCATECQGYGFCEGFVYAVNDQVLILGKNFGLKKNI